MDASRKAEAQCPTNMARDFYLELWSVEDGFGAASLWVDHNKLGLYIDWSHDRRFIANVTTTNINRYVLFNFCVKKKLLS